MKPLCFQYVHIATNVSTFINYRHRTKCLCLDQSTTFIINLICIEAFVYNIFQIFQKFASKQTTRSLLKNLITCNYKKKLSTGFFFYLNTQPFRHSCLDLSNFSILWCNSRCGRLHHAL